MVIRPATSGRPELPTGCATTGPVVAVAGPIVVDGVMRTAASDSWLGGRADSALMRPAAITTTPRVMAAPEITNPVAMRRGWPERSATP